MTCSSIELPETHATSDRLTGVDNKAFQSDATHGQGEERSSGPVVAKDHTQVNGSSQEHNDKYTPDVHDEEDSYCGIGSCRPPCVQVCKNMASFSAAVTLASLVASALNSYITSQITTLERHFNFSSSISGFLLSCNDLGYLVTTLFMSYYTRRVHIPRAMALSTAMYGISGVLCAVAFFGTRDQLSSPPKEANISAPTIFFTQMCQNVTTAANISCGAASTMPRTPFGITEHWKQIAIFILAIGMILQGVAKSPRQPFIITYIDDNIPKTKTSIYLGIIVGLSFFGPALAFVLGAVFSSMYITLEETNMTPRDPRWLGAWWLGFIIFGAAGIVVGLPLIFFPKRMRKRVELQVVKPKKSTELSKVRRVWLDFKGILKAMLHLVFNPVYVCLTLASGVNLMGASGMMSFFTKYLETQFTVTAPQASLTIGIMNVLIACVGTPLGGCLTSKLKLSPMACLKFIIGTKILVTGILSLGFAVGCKQPVIHMGRDTSVIHMGTGTSNAGQQVISQCTQHCNCDDTDFFPLCGDDGRNYFSPCHAGCVAMDDMAFTNCSCVAGNETQRSARGGLCIPECTNLYPYLILMSIGFFITMVAMMPTFIVSIRCVKEEDKPFAVGLSAFAGTLIGWFPGPVIFGSLVDSTCIIWRTTCGSVGACSLYDIELFRLRIHGLMIGLRVITLIFFILAYIFAACSKEPAFQPHTDEVSISVTDSGLKVGGGTKKTRASSNTHTNSDNKETYI